jgi:predicted nucleic acid-binding protein
MSEYVVDASVILKWVVGDREEPDQEKAIRLLALWGEGIHNLWAPTLWEYEVANFLGRELPAEANTKMKMLKGLGIKSVVLSDQMIERSFLLMKARKITFYDAAYLADAHEIGGVLITADDKFVKKMGPDEPIMRLKDFNV